VTVLPTTPSQTAGPFFSIGLCADPAASELVEDEAPGAVVLTGRVLDGADEGVPDALVEIWQADGEGVYREDWGWGRSSTDETGSYRLVTVKPGGVPTDDGAPQAPHLSVAVFARGLLKPVFTRMYFPDEDPANDADPVLSALGDSERAALVASSEESGLRFDIRLQGERQTPFFAV
jgi:protocatechuate 3,4-dioxygenase, alpha subunit